MRIENLRKETAGDKSRAIATVTWEDCDRPKQDLYFETDVTFSDDLVCNPHSFLIAAGIPALHYGEARVLVEGEICPELRDGLNNVFLWFRRWYDIQHPPLVIEAPVRGILPADRTPGRAGMFLTGGVDSFATLRNNHLNFAPGHPYYMKDGFYIYGLGGQAVPEAFEMVKESLLAASREAGMTLIPVYTNIYEPYREEDIQNHFVFWEYKYMAAALAGLAHAFAGRINVVSSGSTDYIPDIVSYGHHPLIDPNYSSADLRIRHDGAAMSRFDKIRLIAEWDVALRHLRVCNHYRRFQAGMLNCGECEKCLRTRLSLLSLGKLDQTAAFSKKDVSPEEIYSKLKIKDKAKIIYYKELIDPLKEAGRHDLVKAIEFKIKYFKTTKNGTLKSKIKVFDDKYLNGSVLKMYQSFKYNPETTSPGLKPD